jgi:hypothetical protein
MHVMAAGMRHRHGIPSDICGRDSAGIVKTAGLPDGQGIHVGTQHNDGAFAIAEQADNARLSHAGGHFVAIVLKMLCSEISRPVFLHRQFRVGVEVLVDCFELWKQAGQICQNPVWGIE